MQGPHIVRQAKTLWHDEPRSGILRAPATQTGYRMTTWAHSIKSTDIQRHQTIVVMGTGSIFRQYQHYLHQSFGFTHISDNDPLAIYRLPEHSYTFTAPHQLASLHDPFVIIATSHSHFTPLSRQLQAYGLKHCFINAIEGIYLSSDFPNVHLASLHGEYNDHLGNHIHIGKHVTLPSDLYVQFGRTSNTGTSALPARNNHLVIDEGTQITTINGTSTIQFMGNNSRVRIGKNNIIHRMQLHIGSQSTVITGERCAIQSVRMTTQGGKVQLGNDCMLSHDIELWQTDTHPIFDLNTGLRLNKIKDILLGDHIWLGLNTTLLAGTVLGNDSIAGAKTVTSARFPENVVIAGNPARILRNNITWTADELTVQPNIAQRSDSKL